MAERVAKLLTHGAVDEEVDRIADEDAEVDEHRRQLPLLTSDEHELVERVLGDHCYEENGERKLDEQEHADDGK